MRAILRSGHLHTTAITQESSRSPHTLASNQPLDRLRVLFVTSARTEGPANQNHFQRIMVISRLADLTILAPHGSDFSLAKANGARVIAPLFPGRLGVLGEVVRVGLS